MSVFPLTSASHVFRRTPVLLFGHFPPSFLSSSGHAAYGTAVDLYPGNTGVGATYFMTYHTILKESPDYIHALKIARSLAENITQSVDHEVFAYRQVPLVLHVVLFA